MNEETTMPQHDDENGAERADATEDVGTGSTEVIGDVSSTGPTEVIEYEDEKGRWHVETARGSDRPATSIKDRE